MDKNILKQFDKAWREPARTVSELKEASGKKAIGMVLTDAPEELIHAAGAIPVAALAWEVAFQHADRHLQGFACSYSRSVIELIERGEYDFLDGLIVPYACDTTRCMDLILRYMDKFEFYDCVRIPKRVSADGVRKYYRAELERVGKSLAKFTGQEITGERLSGSIRSYNRVRSLLQKFRDALQKGEDGISPSECLSAVRAAMILLPEEISPLLERAVESFSLSGSKANGGPGVVVAGKLPQPPGLIDVITNAGLRVLEDHLVVGGRWVSAGASEDGDPWKALVERQLDRLPFAGIWDRRSTRAEYLIERIKALGADGAVFLVQKFCEPAEMDYPGIKEELEANDIPLLSIETDHSQASLEAIKTRVEAFAEMLMDRSS